MGELLKGKVLFPGTDCILQPLFLSKTSRVRDEAMKYELGRV